MATFYLSQHNELWNKNGWVSLVPASEHVHMQIQDYSFIAIFK